MLTQGLDIDADVQQSIALPSRNKAVLAILKPHTVAVEGRHTRDDGAQDSGKESTTNQRLKHKRTNSLNRCTNPTTPTTRRPHTKATGT